MHALIDDVLDLLRGRVQPLVHYQYPTWQPLLLLMILGAVVAPGATDVPGPIEGKLLFFVLLTCLQALLLSRFMGWWLKVEGWREHNSLFGLVAITNALQFLEPLTSWLSDNMGAVVQVALSLLSLLVLINALAVVSGRSRLRVLLGAILFSPLALALLFSCVLVGSSLGWIDLPADTGTGLPNIPGAASKAL